MTTTTTIELGHRFADEVPGLSVDWQPVAAPEVARVVVNEVLADELGIDPEWLRSDEGLAVLAGNAVPPGARPVAMAYAGHQFGNYNPQLGDGRALLLGEWTTPDGGLVDVHLKGSGRTPFARGGDGRATLGPMLRELVVSEAMHALGIPTTRSLAVVTTGERVARQRVEPGAVLTRTAASHLRVGTFQFARFQDDPEVLSRLLDHAIARHHPDAAAAERPALAFLDHVVAAQAELVARWMAVGFVHGVLNTDNTAVSGEGIDYGPCAFMDHFAVDAVYSSIDHGGRYAYGNQPAVLQWNLARLAEALLVLVDPDRDTAVALATESLEAFTIHHQAAFGSVMGAKLGLDPTRPVAASLLDGLIALEAAASPDHTSVFRALATSLRGDDGPLRALFPDHGDDLDEWVRTWHGALGDAEPVAVADAMDRANPTYIPRNHLVEEALDAAAVDGDLGPLDRLLDHVTHPFEVRPGSERYAAPAPPGFDDGFQTFCGT